ncbi:HdeD family acid-resistance protein [Streptomyces sp. BV286]|uniref:HdeD family acid-resistance protein n=1 Tax=unclassified Streptomyces TaxID=2593676 RepID=UPI001C2E5879|nr:HdeD family acid-resistance protein [Streptomyces sp. BV286]MBV1941863.1 HdeD family acid-resistance protein [Streptomyces sp. BV286]
MTAPRDPTQQYDGPRPVAGEAATGPAGGPADVLTRLGRSWTWILVSALVTLVPGVLLLVWPDGTLHVVAVLIGLYLLTTGAFRFVSVFAHKEHGERLPGLFAAVLFVLAGVLCLRNPLQTIAALSLIVGAVWLVSGLLTLYTAITAKDLPHRGVVLTVALLGIVAGIVVLALPSESARALTRLLGLWLVLLGLAETALALAWRAALNKAAEDPASRLGA